MSQECSNRETITAAILKYMEGLPEPKSLPLEISFEVRFEAATERHVIKFEDAEAAVGRKTPLSATAAEVVALYHELCTNLPKVRFITDKRKKDISTRLRKHSMEELAEVFSKANASAVLCGKNSRKWVANFDWLMNENNIAKVLEGNYDNRGYSGKAQSFDVNEAFAMALARTYGG